MNLQDIFGQYVGQTLKDPLRAACDTDEILENIKATAARHGLSLRVQWPSSRGDCRHDERRVNFAVKKEGNGKLYIQNKFWLG